MRPLAIALVLVLGGACSDEAPAAEETLTEETWPEPLEDDLVVRWRARDGWGLEHFEIGRDGESRYRIERARAPALEVERTIDGDELKALRERLLALDCCALQSDPVTAFGDPLSEGMLELRLPGLSCDVHRVLHRWDDESTVRCDDAVRQLHGRIRPRGTPPDEAEAADGRQSAGEASPEDEAADHEQSDQPVGEVPPG